MRRIGYLGISLLLVFVLAASALPGYGQAAPAAQAKGPQAKTQAEYTAHVTFFNEKDPVKKAPLGEKFITDFKESDFIPASYTQIITAYTQAQNWPKVVDAAERAAASPVADTKLKAFAYANAMVASQNFLCSRATRATSPTTPRRWWRWNSCAAAAHSSCEDRSRQARAPRCSMARCAASPGSRRAIVRCRVRARSSRAGS